MELKDRLDLLASAGGIGCGTGCGCAEKFALTLTDEQLEQLGYIALTKPIMEMVKSDGVPDEAPRPTRSAPKGLDGLLTALALASLLGGGRRGPGSMDNSGDLDSFLFGGGFGPGFNPGDEMPGFGRRSPFPR